MKCEYCNSEFKTTSALNNHKNKAKYCLIIQGKIDQKEQVFKCERCEKILSSKQMLEFHTQKCEGKKEKIEEFKCEYCNKMLSSKQYLENHIKKCEIIEEKEEFKCEYCDKILSTKQMLENHKNICIIKKDKEIEALKEKLESKDKELKEQFQSKDNKIEILKKELKEKDKLNIKLKLQNENYEKQIEKQEEQNKVLLNKLENLASKAIDKPTSIVSNTTTNNNLNIATSMDFDNIEHIKNLIDNYLTINHIVDGQKGIANFVRETMLIDDNGIPKYICTDPSRNIFKYKDTNGEIKKDVEAKKLTGSLVKGGIRKQTAIIGNDWLESEENSNDYLNKLELMMEFQQNIHKLADNNIDFRKELVLITS
jgi:glycerophosphoryl diester phosphodiesterase